MERLIFEGRFLVNVIGGIMRQEDLRVISGRIDWERMFRTADYHKIAGIVYLGSLGSGDKIPEKWQERFFKRFQESLRFGESCIERQKEVFAVFEMMEVPLLVLSSCELRELYPTPEMASSSLLKLLFAEEDYVLAKGYLIDLGYEMDGSCGDYGERMKHPSGFTLDIYRRFPFKTKLYLKRMRNMAENARLLPKSSVLHCLTPEDQLTYMLAGASYAYASDTLQIRDVLDLYVYHTHYREKLNIETVMKRLEAFQVDGLAEKILKISYMWFGKKEEFQAWKTVEEETTVFDILENRILSNGVLNKESDIQAIELNHRINEAIKKEQRRELRAVRVNRWNEKRQEIKKILRWIFPEYRYMCSIYPILEKVPVFLPFCWLWRGIRQIKILIAK